MDKTHKKFDKATEKVGFDWGWSLRSSWLLFLLWGHMAHGQAPAALLRKDLKKDFGAVGDGRTNDQAAFGRAADFFNKRALTAAGATEPAVLSIPKGVYLVGQQETIGNMPEVLVLSGCRNLSIEGADSATTEIRYASGLRYGSFDPATKQPYEAPTAFFTDRKYAATGGTCIVLSRCENVKVSNLAINGNSSKAIIGGHWGDTGIQLNYDGVFISESRHIALRQLALHHLGRDGIQVLNHLAKRLDDPNQEDILLENLTCNYNGRQGLSLTGVNGIRAVNCSFSHTGRVQITSTGKPLFSNPGAGIDLEPEGAYVLNVSLENCRFVDNAGQGIVSDRVDTSRPIFVRNVVISNSLVWGITNWSAWVTQPGFLFKNCRIYGSFVHGCQAATSADATRFVGCTFEDRPYHGQPAYGAFLLHSDAYSRHMSFTDCRFVGTHNYLIQAVPQLKDSANLFHFRNCTFLLDYAQPPKGSYDKIMGSMLSGNVVFQSGPHRSSLHRTDFLIGDPNTLVTTTLQAPGSLQLRAPNCYYLVQGSLAIGRNPTPARDSAVVTVGLDNALVFTSPSTNLAEMYIGPSSRLVVKKGGSLEILRHTKLTIAGQLVVEDGAYFFRDPQAQVTTIGRGQLRVSTQAIKTKHPTLRSNYY